MLNNEHTLSSYYFHLAVQLRGVATGIFWCLWRGRKLFYMNGEVPWNLCDAFRFGFRFFHQ